MKNTIEFRAVDGYGQPQHHRLQLSSLNASFSVLNMLTRNGWQLQTITLTDALGHFIELPPQAFDGTPVSYYLRQLENQWMAVLAT